jgi:hypothetical protein
MSIRISKIYTFATPIPIHPGLDLDTLAVQIFFPFCQTFLSITSKGNVLTFGVLSSVRRDSPPG